VTTHKTGTRDEWLAWRRELLRPCAFAYRVEKSSGPETYQNAPERRVPEWSHDGTHNRAGLEAACSETVKGELPDVPSMSQ
jgi:hypothetical protein